MLAPDGLAGAEQILLLVAEDSAVALQALTAVGEGIDGRAGAMHASGAERRGAERGLDRGVQWR